MNNEKYNIPKEVSYVTEILQKSGFESYLVGGCVRDTFLNQTPKDFDVCTNATPNEIVEILKSGNINFQLQGEHFGIVVAKMAEDIEIATFRFDESQDTGNNQDTIVTFGATIEQDVMRRDITINGLFMDLHSFEIIDLVGGIQDLNDGIIRCIGNPVDRFKEDSLRKLRCVRFSSRLGFAIHEDTLNAIKQDNSLNISEERIVNELTTSFNKAKSVHQLITRLTETTLLTSIFKDIKLNDKISFGDFCTFNLFLSTIISKDNTNLDKKLFKLKFNTKTINSVCLLLTTDIKSDFSPIKFKSKLKSTDLTKDELKFFFAFHPRADFLFDFQMKEITQDLLDKGFTGSELGKQLETIALKLLKQI